MRKTDILIAGTLLALAATASPLRGQEGKAHPTVWMGPPSYDNGKCFRELFEHPDAWKETTLRGKVVCGYEGLPSDWYLRLVGEGARMLRAKIPIPAEIPIEPSGP